MRTRKAVIVVFAALAACAATAGARAQGMGTFEPGTNRFGGDYSQRIERYVQQCRDHCRGDTRCMSWSYVTAGGRCFLKNFIPAASPNPCCISGVVRTTSALVNRSDINSNRPGADYKRFNTTNTDMFHCRDNCDREPNCKAWTWVRPGHQFPQAVCYLKAGVPARVPNPCCISGVKGQDQFTQ